MVDLRLAILVDAENISPKLFPCLQSKVATLGYPAIFRLFGDFTVGGLSPWLEYARAEHLEIEMQISSGKGKNSADILMVIHAMDILHAGTVDGICLVSSDRDFAPLVTRLQASRMKIFGFGEQKSTPELRNTYDWFFELSEAGSAQTDARQIAKVMTEIMAEIIAKNGQDGWIGLSAAALALRKHHPRIAQQICGKGKFLKNLRASGLFKERGAGSTIKVCLSKAS